MYNFEPTIKVHNQVITDISIQFPKKLKMTNSPIVARTWANISKPIRLVNLSAFRLELIWSELVSVG